MSARSMCPSMGAIRRPVSREVTVLANCSVRSFHATPRQLEDPSGNSGSSSGAPPPASTRRSRNTAAVSQISSLQDRSRRAIPRRVAQEGNDASASRPPFLPPGAKFLTPRKPLVRKKEPGPDGAPTGVAARPPGTMVRAPATLNIKRDARGPPRSLGPNKGGPRSSGNKKNPPKRREGGDEKPDGTGLKGRNKSQNNIEDHITDGMLHHLLRLQRKEWDRVPYEPKYAPGSLAANELVHIGRELFRGDSPDVPIWGRLEKKIGVVGMYGAADRLRVRRVVDRPDGNAKQAKANYVIKTQVVEKAEPVVEVKKAQPADKAMKAEVVDKAKKAEPVVEAKKVPVKQTE